jgi:type II secretion system protein N
MDIKLKRWQRWTAYAAFTFLAFLLALRQTAPVEAVKERFIMEAAAQGWEVAVADVRPAGFMGVGMKGITLESRDGLRISIDRLDATPRLWPLLLGRVGVAFDAHLFDGRVQGFAEEGRATRRVVAAVSDVDLARALPLRRATGLDLVGKLRGELDLTLDQRAVTKSEGWLDVAVDGAAVNGGQMPVPGMGGAITVPKVTLGQVTAKAVVKEGKLTFEQLAAKSSDLDASGNGLYCVLRPRLALAPIFGKARFKFSDGFWARGEAAAFKDIVEMALAQARGQDGAYGFQIFGTLAQPQARMAP